MNRRGSPLQPYLAENIDAIYQGLLATGIPRETANGLISDVLRGIPDAEWGNAHRIWSELANQISQQVSTVEPWTFEDGQGIAVFIGPTGVGKTTTIAKLAANFALVAGKKVGVITTDTYRIAAVDQLKTYADIIGIPFEVVFSPKELNTAVAKTQDRDLILIDTAGRSPSNQLHINELRSYFQGVPVEVHLVVSATTKESDIPRLVEVFGEIPIDRVVITKLDETTTYGIILHVSKLAKAPISFVTTGQGVPDDIEVADGQHIKLILGTSYDRSGSRFAQNDTQQQRARTENRCSDQRQRRRRKNQRLGKSGPGSSGTGFPSAVGGCRFGNGQR